MIKSWARFSSPISGSRAAASRDQAIRLVKAIQELPGPVFVHCHHGKHRGPAAAAVCAMTTEGWDKARAQLWLGQAGTDPRYKGLFATVDRFTPRQPPRRQPRRLPHAAPRRRELPIHGRLGQVHQGLDQPRCDAGSLHPQLQRNRFER